MTKVTPTPFPTFIPQSPAEQQQLELLQQVQNHTIPPFHAFILGLILNCPLPNWLFPIEARLALYNALTLSNIPIFSSQDPNPLVFSIFVMFWPVIFLLGVFFTGFLLLTLIRAILALLPLVSRRFIKPSQLSFLELVFPSDTSKSAYATEQLYILLHNRARRQALLERLLRIKKTFSLEIVSSRDEGIRFILVLPQKEEEIVQRTLLSFHPALKIRKITDYLPSNLISQDFDKAVGIAEMKLSSDFAFPLKDLKTLSEHDPISYITGHMTKLSSGDLVSLQLVTTPIVSTIHGGITKRLRMLRSRIRRGLPLTPALTKKPLIPGLPSPLFAILGLPIWAGVFVIKVVYTMLMGFLRSDFKGLPFFEDSGKNLQELLNPYEKELGTLVKDKIDQSLFETTIRFLVISEDNEEVLDRLDELTTSLGPFGNDLQSFRERGYFPFLGHLALKNRVIQFQNRLLSPALFHTNPILSANVDEIA